MNRRNIAAIVAILLAAIVGAYESSMVPTGSFQLSEIETVGSFIIRADSIMISGDPISLLMCIASASDGSPIASAEQVHMVATNLNITKVEGGKILEILATSSNGSLIKISMTSLSADSVTFSNLEIVDVPKFSIQTTGSTIITVTMTNVEIHAVYLYAQSQKLEGMKLNVKSA